MNDLLCFDFDERAVRIVMIDGTPWWVASDICAILDLGNVTMALRKLDADQVTLNQIEGASNGRPVNVISESGMWTLVLRSDKPQAVAVRRWLTDTVLPALRQSGTYTMPGIEDPALDADQLAEGAMPSTGFDPIRLNAAVAVVREARRLFGPRAARAIWAALGLPDPDALAFAAAIPAHAFPDGLAAALVTWIDGKDRLTYQDIGHGLGIGAPDRIARHRIADILTAHGWTWRNTKFGQAQRWTWRAPSPPPSSAVALAGEIVQ